MPARTKTALALPVGEKKKLIAERKKAAGVRGKKR
jgi:hypothetical protein